MMNMMVLRRYYPSDHVTSDTLPTLHHSRFNERHFVLALCCLAAIRVFVYSAAFPFFNNVDESPHFDLVVKYSHGLVPRKMGTVSIEASNYVRLYGSLEYYLKPEQLPFKSPVSASDRTREVALWGANPQSPNHESSQAPLYYAAAALWMRFGELLGVAGAGLLYWIRFLNVFLAAVLVWLGFAASSLIFPEDRFVRLGVPLLLTALPQDIFYSIQNDVLSPLFFGIAFIGLVLWSRADTPSAKLGVCTGLSLAAAYLTKISNLPLIVVAAAALLIQAWRLSRTRRLRAAAPAFRRLLLSAGLPIICLSAWNLYHFGDLTGSRPKIKLLGWTQRPISQWLTHPIFTLRGFSYFWSELMASFWRGEFVWGMKRLAFPAADAFYWISSIVLLGAAIIGLFPRFSLASKPQQNALWLALSSFVASVAYLALLSIVFDYGGCMYPSRAFPYFTSGRLLAGTLIPFFLVYLYGLKWIAQKVKGEGLLWWILGGMIVLMVGSQIAVDRVAFASQWNWFHLVLGFG
jgi:hypothetical protein